MQLYWSMIETHNSTDMLLLETVSDVETVVEIDKETLDAALNYTHSIKQFNRRLKFLHIPKNAGSAIEEIAGGERPQPWGGCLFKHRPRVSRKNGNQVFRQLYFFLKAFREAFILFLS